MFRVLLSFFVLLLCGGALLAQPSGKLSGTIVDGQHQPVPQAEVSIWKNGAFKGSANTDNNGLYTISNLWPGTYNVEISAAGFPTSLTNTVKILADTTITLDKALSDKKKALNDAGDATLVLDEPTPATHAPMGRLEGIIVDDHGQPIASADVIIRQQGQEMTRTETDLYGNYSINPLWVDTYDIEISKNGFKTSLSRNVKVKPSITTRFNMVLTAIKPLQPATLNQGDKMVTDTSARK